MRLYIALILIPIFSCNIESNIDMKYAETGTYYFNITQDLISTNETDLASGISIMLLDKKYAITNKSGITWPFFQEFLMTDNIQIANLMTPHTISHVLIDIEDAKSEYNNGDSKLDIALIEKNGEYSFDMIIYKWKQNDWVKIVDTGNHKISKDRYETKKDLAQILYKTIIRYSFK